MNDCMVAETQTSEGQDEQTGWLIDRVVCGERSDRASAGSASDRATEHLIKLRACRSRCS